MFKSSIYFFSTNTSTLRHFCFLRGMIKKGDIEQILMAVNETNLCKYGVVACPTDHSQRKYTAIYCNLYLQIIKNIAFVCLEKKSSSEF
jgi:hypothetical protein